MDNISAHLQVHKNQKAVDEFLRRFIKDAKFILINKDIESL